MLRDKIVKAPLVSKNDCLKKMKAVIFLVVAPNKFSEVGGGVKMLQNKLKHFYPGGDCATSVGSDKQANIYSK